jgi:molecular chaperone DnaK
MVIGHKASIRIGTVPSPIRSIKRLMGQQTKVKLTDEEATPEQISAFILKEMKKKIEEDVKEFSTDTMEWIVDRAIITVPAYFDQPQIEATLRAGELAGLEVLELLHEPTSSACHYCWKNNVQNGVFLVYDLGGGTFDVTVLRCTEGEFEVLGISGNRLLGGDDMDRIIAKDLQDRLLKEGYALELNIENEPEDSIRFNKLKFLAEGVKIALSRQNVGEFNLSDTASLKDKEGLPVLIETIYTKPEIETLIRPIIERTITYCFEALEQASKKADVKLSDVDAVILAGGPTHIPLVREIVRQHLCSPGSENVVDDRARQPRAKCTEPVYEKVDTVVALGAAIRAAASGGLAVYNPEKTVRVSFRGTGVTNAIEGRMGGRVEALYPGINIDDGYIKLIIPEMNYEDKDDIKEGGTFAFTHIPLEAAAKNMLTFEVYDRLGNLVATVGRQVEHTTEEVHPMGAPDKRAIIPKAIRLEVLRDGKPSIKELIPALCQIPISENFTFSHPGDTEIIVFHIYQHKRKIKDIKVKVPSSLPKGTPVELNIQVDEHSLITVKGKIGETSFDAIVEPPQDRDMPTDQEIKALDNAFQETLMYLPEGKKKVAEAKYKKAKLNLDAAAKSGEKNQAVNDFEEMEELVAEFSHTSGSIQPPKEFFDKLVGDCLENNQYVASIVSEAGNPHDSQELAKEIEVHRIQGERAYKDGDQKSYSEAIMRLVAVHDHLIGLYQKIKKPVNEPTEEERASAHVQYAEGEASMLSKLAAAQSRKDFQDEIEQIQRQLRDLSKEAHRSPREVQEKVYRLRKRLEQIKNVLMGKVENIDEKLPEDHSYQG